MNDKERQKAREEYKKRELTKKRFSQEIKKLPKTICEKEGAFSVVINVYYIGIGYSEFNVETSKLEDSTIVKEKSKYTMEIKDDGSLVTTKGEVISASHQIGYIAEMTEELL